MPVGRPSSGPLAVVPESADGVERVDAAPAEVGERRLVPGLGGGGHRHDAGELNLDGDSDRLREHHDRNENLRATTTGTRQPLR